MVYDSMDTGCTDNREPSSAPEGIPAERFSPVSLLSNPLCCEMSLPVLTAQCLRELDNYRRGEPCTDAYGLELLRRVIIQSDPEAWACVLHCFGELVRGWLRRHPQREVACRLESEEHYVVQTFERFWQAIALNQHVEFISLDTSLQYLCVCLNGVIVDTLRADRQSSGVPLSVTRASGDTREGDSPDNSVVCNIFKMVLSDQREQRLAYLLFHCGLSPREIIRFCPQEWSDVQEMYRLRRTILGKFLLTVDQKLPALLEGGRS
jgi:hypothetical protein